VPDWLFWLSAAVALLAVEMLVAFTFVAGPIAVAAGTAGIAAAFEASIELQLAIFIVVALLVLLFVRPVAKRHLEIPPEIATNVHALVGRRAVVLDKVDLDEGKVRIGDNVWTARTQSEAIVLMPGDTAKVVEVRGVHAFVVPADKPETGGST
jgi:membrane protein implicated in regulation of membrane protease activity